MKGVNLYFYTYCTISSRCAAKVEGIEGQICQRDEEEEGPNWQCCQVHPTLGTSRAHDVPQRLREAQKVGDSMCICTYINYVYCVHCFRTVGNVEDVQPLESAETQDIPDEDIQQLSATSADEQHRQSDESGRTTPTIPVASGR